MSKRQAVTLAALSMSEAAITIQILDHGVCGDLCWQQDQPSHPGVEAAVVEAKVPAPAELVVLESRVPAEAEDGWGRDASKVHL
jgi:hypothetical protein